MAEFAAISALLTILAKIKRSLEEIKITESTINELKSRINRIEAIIEEKGKLLSDKLHTLQFCNDELEIVNKMLNFHAQRFSNRTLKQIFYNVIFANIYTAELAQIQSKLFCVQNQIQISVGLQSLEENKSIFSFLKAVKSDTEKIIKSLRGDTSSNTCNEKIPIIRIFSNPDFKVDPIDDHIEGGMAEFRDALAQIADPINCNPYYDVLIGSSLGEKLSDEEKIDLRKMINDSDEASAVAFFESKGEKEMESLNEELNIYFERCYGEGLNLVTVIRQAIEYASRNPLHLHLDKDVDYFKNHVLVYDRSNNTVNNEFDKKNLIGDIVFCHKKDNIISLAIKDFNGLKHRLCIRPTIGTMESVRNAVDPKFNVYIYEYYNQTLYAFIKSLLSNRSFKRTCIHIDSNKTLLRFSKTNSDQMEQIKSGVYEVSIIKHEHNSVFGFKTDSRICFLFKNKDLEYKIYSDEDLNQYNQYSVRYEELLCEDKDVSSKFLQLRSKIEDINSMRFRLEQELIKCRNSILSNLKQDYNCRIVDSVLNKVMLDENDKIVENLDLNFTNEWLSSLNENLRNDILTVNEIRMRLVQSTDNNTNNDSNSTLGPLVLTLCLEAACLRFLQYRKESLAIVDIINRLTQADILLETLFGKDLVLFIGDTGAGKSTLINYFTGVPLKKITWGSFIKYIVAPNYVRPCAKIGTYMTLSETPFVEGYEILDAKKSMDIIYELLRLGDCPGRGDTRGKQYDLTASLCISKAIRDANSIKGIVLVIPYRYFSLSKGSPVIESFRMLSNYFRDGLFSLNDKDKNQIYLVISHSKNPSSDCKEFNNIIIKYCEEAKQFLGDIEEAKYRLNVWEFIRNMTNNGRVLFVSLDDCIDRKKFLKACYSKMNKGIGSEDKGERWRDVFRSAFDSTGMKLEFDSAIRSSLYIWKNLLLQKYLDLLADVKKNENKKIDSNKKINTLKTKNTTLLEGAKSRNKSIITIHNDIDIIKKIMNSKQFNLESFKSEFKNDAEFNKLINGISSINSTEIIRLQTEDGILNEDTKELSTQKQELQLAIDGSEFSNLITGIRNLNSTEIIRLQTEDGVLNEDIKELSTQKQELQLAIDDAEINLKATLDYIEELKIHKKDLETGSLRKVLFDCTYLVGSKVQYGTYKDGVKENLYAEVRSVKTEDFKELKEFTVGSLEKKLSSDIYVESNCRIVPIEKLEEFYRIRKAKSTKGDFVAEFEGTNANLGNNIKASPEGKRIIQDVNLNFHNGGQDKQPKYKITHVIPKIEANEAEILNDDSEITRLSASIPSKVKEIEELKSKMVKLDAKLANLNLKSSKLQQDIRNLNDNAITTVLTNMAKEIEENSILIQNNETEILEQENGIISLDKQLVELKAEKFRLAIIIIHNRHKLRCLQKLTYDINKNEESEFHKAVNWRSEFKNDNEDNAQSLIKECQTFIEFCQRNTDSIYTNCSHDLKCHPNLIDLWKGKLEISELPISSELENITIPHEYDDEYWQNVVSASISEHWSYRNDSFPDANELVEPPLKDTDSDKAVEEESINRSFMRSNNNSSSPVTIPNRDEFSLFDTNNNITTTTNNNTNSIFTTVPTTNNVSKPKKSFMASTGSMLTGMFNTKTNNTNNKTAANPSNESLYGPKNYERNTTTMYLQNEIDDDNKL